jgi:hypothetical protein
MTTLMTGTTASAPEQTITPSHRNHAQPHATRNRIKKACSAFCVGNFCPFFRPASGDLARMRIRNTSCSSGLVATLALNQIMSLFPQSVRPNRAVLARSMAVARYDKLTITCTSLAAAG